jgi:hypothetical protein
MERMLIAVGRGQMLALIAYQGALIETDLDRGDSCLLEQFKDGLTDNDPEDPGLYVWEGSPWAEMSNSYMEGEQFEGYRFDGGAWRTVDVEELANLYAGLPVWPSVLAEEHRAEFVDAVAKVQPSAPMVEAQRAVTELLNRPVPHGWPVELSRAIPAAHLALMANHDPVAAERHLIAAREAARAARLYRENCETMLGDPPGLVLTPLGRYLDAAIVAVRRVMESAQPQGQE